MAITQDEINEIGTGSDTLTLKITQDAYQGDAQYAVFVDGQQVGGTFTATALRNSGQFDTLEIKGDWGVGNHTVSVKLLNDLYGGSPTADRNVYVESATYNGSPVSGSQFGLYSNPDVGSFSVADSTAVSGTTPTPAPTPAPVTGSDTLVLKVTQSLYQGDTSQFGAYYQGDAKYAVFVDGKQIGSTYTASAVVGSGQVDTITLKGDWGVGPHKVTLRLLNDLFGGTPQTDRNLFLESATYNGSAVPGSGIGMYTSDPASFTVNDTTAATTPTPEPAPSTSHMAMVGVNLAGGEFAGGHRFPDHSNIDYYASKSVDVVRVPFKWENIQRALNGSLDATELAKLTDTVNYAASKGMKVIIDVHNYGFYHGNLIGSTAVPNSAFADLWSKLAGHFKGNPSVIFGLMNEPYDQTATQWLTSVNAAIDAIRDTGAKQQILVPGTYWDGGHSWLATDNDTVFAAGVKDPLDNYAIEVHQYLGSGGGVDGFNGSPTFGVEALAGITNWARGTGHKLFLGEFGAKNNPGELAALDNMLSYMDRNADVWQGGTYWAGGGHWLALTGSGVTIDPLNGQDVPQMDVLEKYLQWHIT